MAVASPSGPRGFAQRSDSRTYAPLERDKAEAYLAAVLTMPCTTDEEAQWFVEATQSSSHFKTPAIMRRFETSV